MEKSRGGPISPWARRQQLPSLSAAGAAAAVLLLCLIASFSAQMGIFALPAAALAGGIFGALLLLHRTPLSPAAVLPVGGVILLFAADAWSGVWSALCIPLGFAAAFAVYRGMRCMASSVLSAVSAGIFLTLAGIVRLLIGGMTVREGIRGGYDALYDMLCSWQITVPGGRLTVFSPEAAQVLCDMAIPVFPGIAAAVLFLIGCAVSGTVRVILRALGADGDFFPAGWPMRAGKSCAVIWCTAQVLLLLAVTTPNARPMYYAVYNTVIIFMIPLALTGFSVLLRQFRRMDTLGTLGRIAVVALILMIALAGMYWFMCAAALYGVYTVFRPGTDGE